MKGGTSKGGFQMETNTFFHLNGLNSAASDNSTSNFPYPLSIIIKRTLALIDVYFPAINDSDVGFHFFYLLSNRSNFPINSDVTSGFFLL